MKHELMSDSVILAMELLYQKKEQFSKMRDLEAVDYALDYFTRNPQKEGSPRIMARNAMRKGYQEGSRRGEYWSKSTEGDLTDLADFNKNLVKDDKLDYYLIDFNDFLNKIDIKNKDKEILKLLAQEYDINSIATITNQTLSITRVKVCRLRKKVNPLWKGVA